MQAKITDYRTLQIILNNDTRTVETIFIEDILGLKNEGDSVLLVRKNVGGLSSLGYLETEIRQLGHTA